MDLPAPNLRWFLPLLLLAAGICATARGEQANSVSASLANAKIQGETNTVATSLPFEISAAPAYEYSITGNVHGVGPVFSVLVPASEPVGTAFEAIGKGFSSILTGGVANPGATLPSTIVSQQISSGTNGTLNATMSISIDSTGVVTFALTSVAIVTNGQPDTTDELVFDNGNVTITALAKDINIATLTATNVTTESATMRSSVICPNNFEAYFIYGTGTSLSGTSTMVNLEASGSAQTVSIPVSGLLPHQVYYFEAVAQDITGPTYGGKEVMKTDDVAPVTGTFSAFAGLAPTVIPVLSHASDADGASLKVVSVTNGLSGVAHVVQKGAAATYQFRTAKAAQDHFTYTVADDFGGSATGRVNLTNFASLVGTYSAVLLNPSAQYVSGGYLRVTLTATGRCTGTLTIAGVSYPFTGALNADGTLSVTLNTSAPAGTTITLALAPSGNGYALSAGASMNGVYLEASLPPAAAGMAGTYTIAFPPGGAYAGAGYAVAKAAAAGSATVTGALPDGTPFSCSTVVDSTGQMGVYSVLYSSSNPGTLAGTLSVSGSSLISGTLVWTKPAYATASINPGPFTITLTGSGGRYAAPAGKAALQFGTLENAGQAVVTGGNLNTPVEHGFLLSPANLVTIITPASDHLALTIQPATGLFTGHFVDPLNGSTRTVHGVLLQGSRQAEGYFLGDSASGDAKIAP